MTIEGFRGSKIVNCSVGFLQRMSAGALKMDGMQPARKIYFYIAKSLNPDDFVRKKYVTT